jgi:hypothetical protein
MDFHFEDQTQMVANMASKEALGILPMMMWLLT